MAVDTGLFLRGLWGRPGIGKYKRYLSQLESCASNRLADPATVYYCYGIENRLTLQRMGINPVVLSADPMVAGWSFWRHKMEIIKAALAYNHQVVWLDADCVQVRPTPENFWSRLQWGQRFRASLRRHRRCCLWRGRGSDKTRVPHGGWLYFRQNGLLWLEEIIRLLEQDHSDTDEVAIMRFLDNLHGTWIGDDRWAELYEPGVYDQVRVRKKVLPCDPEPIFATLHPLG